MRELARDTGAPAYLAGGPVRDALLGAPVQDLDFSVEGDAPALARMLAVRTGGRAVVHPQFGTATVILPPTQDEGADGRIDLVTARSERYPRPGRLPVVAPGSIMDDLARRDFTINAMALPLSGPGTELLDPLGGLDDLRAGIIRFLHPLSFVDDPTRMMRAVRYEQRFGFRISEETSDGMAIAISSGCMETVSGDRWRHELERILNEENPVAPLLRTLDAGLLEGLHPAFGQPGANGEFGLQLLTPFRDSGGALTQEHCLAALFSPLTESEAEKGIQRLGLRGQQAALARDTIGLRDSEPLILGSAGRPSELVRILEGRDEKAVLDWADLTRDEGVAEALRRYAEEWRFVRPEVSGVELLAMGVAQGPGVGKILEGLREARLDGRVKNKEEELALARHLAKLLNADSSGESRNT